MISVWLNASSYGRSETETEDGEGELLLGGGIVLGLGPQQRRGEDDRGQNRDDDDHLQDPPATTPPSRLALLVSRHVPVEEAGGPAGGPVRTQCAHGKPRFW